MLTSRYPRLLRAGARRVDKSPNYRAVGKAVDTNLGFPANSAKLMAMADWTDVRRIALSLPETTEQSMHGLPSWRVRKKLFVWERPLRKSDLEALGEAAPDGPILGARVEHLLAKEALLADDPTVYFTTPHFDGYPSVLVRLERIAVSELEELTIEAWLARAPKRLAKQYLDDNPRLG